MPRKVRVPADPAQNRQNQQRSRARRREYLASLENRLREFEHREIQATLEMQQAAREVAWVNGRLMELLAVRGVSTEEVNEFLQRERHGKDLRARAARGHTGASQKPKSGDRGLEPAGTAVLGSRTARSSSGDMTEPEAATGERACAHLSTADQNILSTNQLEKHDPVIVCDGPTDTPKLQTDISDVSRALITSCDDAASIIADFQGHGDVLEVRKSLGCEDVPNCHIRNTMLFQLMDEAG
ncbi:hypothetical protein F5Y19DRAFT_438560 [Xylariaceae sp. FL1651]|nr:hypothetical protein F5Y19DRAFT_438560 [Xylariaceae sp. FL1651]